LPDEVPRGNLYLCALPGRQELTTAAGKLAESEEKEFLESAAAAIPGK
jgi:hypothetical protein